MTDENRAGDQIETEQQARETGISFVELWLKKIEAACDEEKDWRKEAEKAVDIYEADEGQKTSFNIFHSNVETLIPALYNSTPVPDVRRRYGDPDPVAKLTVDMAERSLSYLLDLYDFDGDMRATVKDGAVPGRGLMRVRYKPHFIQQIDPQTGQPIEVKGYEELTCERVLWDRFVRGPARRWADVPWIAFKHDLTRDELLELSPDVGAKIDVKSSGNDDSKDSDDPDKGIFRTACVWEIWDKASKRVVFIAAEYKDEPLKVEQDPLGLTGFFPVPRPLQQLERVSSLTPVCPYTIYRPLIEELDVITKRIRKLVAQLKVKGIIAADIAKDAEALRAADDGQYIAANESASFVAGGGRLENAVAHWPLDPTVKALQQLYVQRDAIKATIYEVTGLSDILRGASNAQETATAQQIKSQWGSLRVQMLQKEVQRFARDLFRMKTEIMAKHFEPHNMIAMANFQSLPPQQMQLIPQAIELFKSDTRGFRIDIETDSTIRADMSRNQEQMNMFLAGTSQFAQAMVGVVQLAPQMLPVVAEVYTAFARHFNLGKQAEDALDGLSQMAPQLAQQAGQGEEDPNKGKLELEKAKTENHIAMAREKHGLEMQKMQADVQAQAMKNDLDMQRRADQLRTDMLRNQMPQQPNGVM